jgi:hypothetical protein
VITAQGKGRKPGRGHSRCLAKVHLY